MIKIKRCSIPKANIQSETVMLEPGDELYDKPKGERPMRKSEFTDAYLNSLNERRVLAKETIKAANRGSILIFEDDHTLEYVNKTGGKYVEAINIPCVLDVEKIRSVL